MALNKRKLHHWLVLLRHVHLWQLFIAAVLVGGIAAYLLRQNNLTMIDLRNDVKTADNNNQHIKESLVALQKYVASHMNAGLGDGVFLDKSYERDYQNQLQTAANTPNPNEALYAQVEAECRPLRAQGGYLPYTQCAHDKLSTIPGNDAYAAVQPPSVSLYTYNFVSPLWSPDLAGLSVLAFGVLVLFILLRVLGYLLLYILLRIRRA